MAKKRATGAKIKTSEDKTLVKVNSVQSSGLAVLRTWNVVAAIVLLVQAIAILILNNTTSLPVNAHYLAKDELASRTAGHMILAQAVHHLFDVRMSWLLAAFLAVAGVLYALFATVLRPRYEALVVKRANGWRWGANAVSVGLMFAALLMVNGMYDAASLLMLLGLVAVIQLLGYMSEVLAAQASRAKWWAYAAMFAAGTVVWLTIVGYVKDAVIYGNGLPHYVYWLDGSVLIVALLLAANKFLVVQGRGKWADYVYGERLFTLLLVVAMSAVAWQVFFGLH